MVNRIKSHAKPDSNKGSRFVYRERPAKAFKERSEQSGGRFDSPWKQGVDTYRPRAGENTIRILPPTWDNAEHFGFDVFMHSYVGPDNSSYLCLQKMKGKHCPICEAAREAKNAGEEDEAKALAVSKKVAVYVIDRYDDADPPVPQIYTMSWTQDKDITLLCYNKKTGKALNIDDPEDGFDIIFTRTGQGLRTRYAGWQVDRESSPVHDEQKTQDDIIDHIQENPIPDLLNFYDADYLEKVLSGTSAEKDDDLDEDRGSKKRGGGRRARDEEEPEVEEEAEEEEETRPSRRRSREEPEARSTRRSSRKEEPEEEEPEVEEEEEEAPRTRRRGSSREEEPEETERRPTRRSRRDEAEEEVEEEAPRTRRRARDEEEEEEAPRSRSRSRRADPDPEEEELDPEVEEEVEEEEEERSSRRGSSSRTRPRPRR